MNPTDSDPSDRSTDPPDVQSNPPELQQATTEALKDAVVDPRHDSRLIERLVRDYVTILKQQGFRPERAVTEATALVVEATGDPRSALLPSVETWTLSVYDEA